MIIFCLFEQIIHFFTKCIRENVHLVSGDGIQTHNLLIMGLVSYILDQGSTVAFFAKMSKLKVNITHCNIETLNNCGFNDCEKASFYNFVNRWHSKVFVLQKAKSFIKNLIVSKKMGQPRPLFHLFSSFQTLQFSQQIKVKISIQYMVLVFEPTNFGTCVSFRNHKTRAPALRT